MNLGKNIEKKCHEKNWSMTRLAKEAGVPKATLHGWITGRRALNMDQLRCVSMSLGVPLYELLFSAKDPCLKTRESLENLFSGDVRVVIQKIL